MVTQKLKKGKMQDVKYIIIINLFILIFCCGLKAQEIGGVYEVENPELTVADVGITYNFRRNGTFERTLHEHLGKKVISGGDYQLVGDTIVLKYKKLGINIESEIKVKTKKKLNSSNILSSHIKVFNSNANPQPGVNLLMQNKEKKIVTGFSSNKEGEFTNISIHDKYIEFLSFSFIAHKEISIRTDTLFGYKTDIEVFLKDSNPTFDNREKVREYLIINSNLVGIVLQALNMNNEKFLKLKKI